MSFLSQQLKERLPYLKIDQIPVTNFSSSAKGIFIIYDDSLSRASKFLQDFLIPSEDLSIPETYLRDIEEHKVVIVSLSIRGIYKGIATLFQCPILRTKRSNLKVAISLIIPIIHCVGSMLVQIYGEKMQSLI